MNKFSLALALTCFGIALETQAVDNLTPASLNPVKIEIKNGLSLIELVKDNQPNAVIIIPAAAEDHPYSQVMYVEIQKEYADFYRQPVAAMAAAELQKYIELATGARLPVITADQPIPSGKSLILVGSSKASRQFGISGQGLRPEGFKVESFARGVAIIGAPLPEPAMAGLDYDGLFGTLFGVYDFLERFIGIRFYYPGEDGTIIPKLKDLIIPPIAYTDYPRYEKRNMYGGTQGEFAGKKPDCTLHLLRYRCAGHGILGANRSYCHTPWDLTKRPGVPKADNEDTRTPLMPCYGNPKTATAFMQSIDDVYNKKGNLDEWRLPDGGGLIAPNQHVIPFSPPDHPMLCKCKYCKNLIDWNAPFHAQASRLYGKFIQDMATRIKEKYPDKIFYIAPYYNFVSVPKGLALPDNVFAQVCLMYGHSLYHDPQIHRLTTEWINGWARATGKKISIYTYPMWPSVESPFPYQYYHNLKKFMKETKDSVNGMYLDSLTSWNKEMPSIYCHFRLMWNPEFDVNAAIKEQTELLYGLAAPYMQKIFDGITTAWESHATVNLPSVFEIGPYQSGSIKKETLYDHILTPQMVADWKKQLQAAEGAVPESSVYRRRIDFSSQPLKLFFLDYDLYKQGFKPESAKVVHCRETPKIDGKLDDAAWETAPEYHFVNGLIAHERNPAVSTAMKIVYDDNGITLGFTITEPDLSQTVTAQPVYQGNSLELFLEFEPGRVYQFIVDSEGRMQDVLYGTVPKRRVGAPVWKVAKGINFWTAEIHIPFSTLDADMKLPAGQAWRANFCRNRVIKEKPAEISRWQTRFSGSHGDIESFGKLRFEK